MKLLVKAQGRAQGRARPAARLALPAPLLGLLIGGGGAVILTNEAMLRVLG